MISHRNLQVNFEQLMRGYFADFHVKAPADKRNDSDEDSKQATMQWLACVKSDVTSAITKAHGLTVGDLGLVPPGSIPTTTRGKIRRAACAEQYRQDQFTRLGS